jgi:hypothetical protein
VPPKERLVDPGVSHVPVCRGRPGRKSRFAPALSHSLGLITQYKTSNESSAVAIELTGLAGHQRELLEAFQECQEGTFQECQEGTCSCRPTSTRTLPRCRSDADESRIAIRLEAKPGAKLDSPRSRAAWITGSAGWNRRAEVIFDVEPVRRGGP